MLEVGNSYSYYPTHRALPHSPSLGYYTGEERLRENNNSKCVKLYSRQYLLTLLDNLDFKG
jgi:hypothetical protein